MQALHIEDQPEVRDTVKRMLERLGYTVISAASTVEGRALYTQGSYDVVICDGNAPFKDDGYDFAVELAGLGQKVVVLAGQGYQDPPVLCLMKPVSLAALRQALATL